MHIHTFARACAQARIRTHTRAMRVMRVCVRMTRVCVGEGECVYTRTMHTHTGTCTHTNGAGTDQTIERPRNIYYA